jgi:uncharacterized lipoprotein YbaY
MKKMFIGLSLVVLLASCGSNSTNVEVPASDSTATSVDTGVVPSVDTTKVVK